MKIKALVPFSNGTLSMEQYQVAEVTDTLGNQLIAAGVAIEIGGGTGGGVLVVTDTNGTLDASYQDIEDAGFAVVKSIDAGAVSIYVLSFYGYNEDYGAFADFAGESYTAENKTDYLVHAT